MSGCFMKGLTSDWNPIYKEIYALCQNKSRTALGIQSIFTNHSGYYLISSNKDQQLENTDILRTTAVTMGVSLPNAATFFIDCSKDQNIARAALRSLRIKVDLPIKDMNMEMILHHATQHRIAMIGCVDNAHMLNFNDESLRDLHGMLSRFRSALIVNGNETLLDLVETRLNPSKCVLLS